jgi:hypothetical protein
MTNDFSSLPNNNHHFKLFFTLLITAVSAFPPEITSIFVKNFSLFLILCYPYLKWDNIYMVVSL